MWWGLGNFRNCHISLSSTAMQVFGFWKNERASETLASSNSCIISIWKLWWFVTYIQSIIALTTDLLDNLYTCFLQIPDVYQSIWLFMAQSCSGIDQLAASFNVPMCQETAISNLHNGTQISSIGSIWIKTALWKCVGFSSNQCTWMSTCLKKNLTIYLTCLTNRQDPK